MRTSLLVLFFFVCHFIYAQDDEKKIRLGKPINSGFVFIDGQYIEPPYILKRKNLALYLNNIKLWEYKVQTENPFWYPVRLGQPPCINKNTSFKEMMDCKDPTGKISWINAVGNYFLTHYGNAADDSIIDYYKHLPNVKELTHRPGEFWKIYFYNGDSIETMFGTWAFYDNVKRWGPNGTGGPKEKDYVHIMDNQIKNIKTYLLQNEIIYLVKRQKSIVPILTIQNKKSKKVLLEYFWKIMNTDYTTKQKLDSLFYFGFYGAKALPSSCYDSIQLSPAFKRQIDKMNSKPKNRKKEELTGSVQLKKMNHNDNQQPDQNKDFSGICFSPANTTIQYYCPFVYDNSVFGQYQNEYSQVYDLLKNQGYSQLVIYLDKFANDDNWGDCSYQSLINMRDAGVAYIATHGTLDGLILWASTSSTSIDTWCNNDPLISKVSILPQDYPYFWDINQPLYYAAAHSDWAAHYWKYTQNQNNALTILSACYSDLNGWTQECGGVAFGYDDSTMYDNEGIKYNNRELLQRMNGNYSNGNKRNAQDAYDDMPIHKDLFEISVNNNNITLCPAIQSKYPDNNQTVGLHGDGWFETDTYCDASIPINDQDFNNSPISFEWTNNGLSITNVHWDDPDNNGLSNKIVFHWEATENNSVTVKINHNYWRSAPSMNGQYHLLDYDKVTPNSEDGEYTFHISNTVPTDPPVADFSYTVSGNTAYFQDQSTNAPTSWHWDFGDGQSSTAQNVQHTYLSNGTYSVKLTVANNYGTSSKTKGVSITNTPQTVTVSGVVQNADNFAPIAGATVSCSYGSTTTNYNGQYSLEVPYNSNDCGYITVSAPGFQSSSTCSCNDLISDKNCDFYLYPYSGIDLKCTSNPDNQICKGHISKFEAVYHNITAINHKWYVDGNYKDYTNFLNTWQTTLDVGTGSHTIKVEVETENGEFLYGQLDVYVNDCSCNCGSDFKIASNCHVIKTGQNVTFWNLGNVPEEIKDETCLSQNCKHESCYAPTGRRWITAYGTPYEYRTNVYPWSYPNPSDPWYYTTSFSNGGKYSIKYEIVTERDVYGDLFHPHEECWSAHHICTYTGCEYYGEIIVIDCNTYSACNNSGCPNSIPGWDEWGRYHQWSGTFYLNEQANSYINNYNIILSACNDVILDDGFIADGTHEFVAETEDFNCHPDKNEQYINNFQQNDSIQSKWDENNYIKIYPNPFYNEIYVSSSLKTIQSIQLYNILGMPVLKSNCFSQDCKINTSQLKDGVYVIEIMIDNKLYRVKLIKQPKS